MDRHDACPLMLPMVEGSLVGAGQALPVKEGQRLCRCCPCKGRSPPRRPYSEKPGTVAEICRFSVTVFLPSCTKASGGSGIMCVAYRLRQDASWGSSGSLPWSERVWTL
jgi:hypothetical protein